MRCRCFLFAYFLHSQQEYGELYGVPIINNDSIGLDISVQNYHFLGQSGEKVEEKPYRAIYKRAGLYKLVYNPCSNILG